jgi:molybdate transport system ATP-binding protein
LNIEARFHIDRGDFSLKVDLSIPGHGVSALFGPSGCGKTTLLRAIAGLEKSQKGYLKVGDTIWQDDQQFLAPHRRPLGYVFQEPSLFAHLTVKRNLEYGLKRLKENTKKISLEQAVELLGIDQLLHRRPHQLSGGEQQRVAIARALAVSPSILLLDEPLAALDLARKQEILPYLESLHRELDIPILYVSHSRDEVARLADHLILLEEGRVLATGPADQLFSQLDLSLAHDAETASVIKAIVGHHDDEFDLSYLDFPGGRFAVARNHLPLSQTVRLQIKAVDVSITLEHQSNTSILNIFAASVDKIAAEGKAKVTVRLMLGSIPILARITRKSALDLCLEPGKPVYVQVKSVALLC